MSDKVYAAIDIKDRLFSSRSAAEAWIGNRLHRFAIVEVPADQALQVESWWQVDIRTGDVMPAKRQRPAVDGFTVVLKCRGVDAIDRALQMFEGMGGER